MAKLVSNLTRIGMQAPELAEQALQMTADDIVAMIRQIVPVDTGALRDSYEVEKVSPSHLRIGSELVYAPYVEYGTVNMGAQPHFTPAFHQNVETFQARLIQLLKAAT